MAMPLPVPDPADDSRTVDNDAAEWPIGPMTFDEYLAYMEETGVMYEYVGGMLYPLNGGGPNSGTVSHAAIAQNAAARLHTLGRGIGCRVYGGMLTLRTPRDVGYIPDVVVACGPPPPNDARHLDRPCLIVEVLSPTTSRVDGIEKLGAYREIGSLRAYWIVEATWRCVHRHWREADGRWQSEDVICDALLPVPCPVVTTLTLDAIYEGVDVPREPPPPVLRRVREPDAEYAIDGSPADVPEYAD